MLFALCYDPRMQGRGGGRRPLGDEHKRRKVTITLHPIEIEALRELALLKRRSQGVLAGELFVRELERERKKARSTDGA